MAVRYRKLLFFILTLAALQSRGVEITHGPILGRLTADSVAVWARTSSPGRFTVRYGTDAAKLDQQSKAVQTALDHDCTGSVQLDGLRPDTRYFYAVTADEHTSPAGSFRTLPAADQVRHPQHNPRGLFNFNFELGCCANQNPKGGIGPSLPAFTTMLRDVKDKVHFGIMNGDFIYEENRDYAVDDWLRQVKADPRDKPHALEFAPTMVGVWENYKTYLARGKNMAEWHRNVPTYFTFDDHDLINDIRGCATAGFRERRAVFRDIGVAAWLDYVGFANPSQFTQGVHFGRATLKKGSDVLVDESADFTKIDWKQAANLHVHWGTPTAGVDDFDLDNQPPATPNAGVYDVAEVLDAHRLRIRPPALADGANAYSIGRRSYSRFRVSNCEFFMLDCKTHREMHDPKNPAAPGISMLGREQREWMLDAMRTSDADFFFVVSSVNFAIPHNGGGGTPMAEGKDEAWTSLLDEREHLIDAWDKLNRPVFVLTADLHNSFVVRVTDRVWEIASAPLNSVNHVPHDDEGDRPATGTFKSGPRTVDIRWSTYVLPDVPRPQRMYPHYCVVHVNNTFNMPQKLGETRPVAFPHPQVIFEFFDGRSGELRYAEAVSLPRAK